MFNGHSIKSGSTLPLVDMGNLALGDIKDVPAPLPGSPTELHVFVEVEKTFVQLPDLREQLTPNDVTGPQHPIHRTDRVVIPIRQEMFFYKPGVREKLSKRRSSE